MKDEKVIEDLMKKVHPETTPQNIEVQTAKANLKKLQRHPFTDTVILATANEHNIIEVANRIQQRIATFARDLSEQSEKFAKIGVNSLYFFTNDLPEMKERLVGHKDARNFYEHLLKGE